MRVIHKSKHLLVAEHRLPWLMISPLLLLALVFLVLGVALGYETLVNPPKTNLLVAWLVVLFCIVVGFLFPVMTLGILLESTKVEFDRKAGYVTIIRRRMFGKPFAGEVIRIALADIKGAYLDGYDGDFDDEEILRSRAPITRPVLRMNAKIKGKNKEIPLMLSHSNTMPHPALVVEINAWLKIWS